MISENHITLATPSMASEPPSDTCPLLTASVAASVDVDVTSLPYPTAGSY